MKAAAKGSSHPQNGLLWKTKKINLKKVAKIRVSKNVR
jgi:hypothetical protein